MNKFFKAKLLCFCMVFSLSVISAQTLSVDKITGDSIWYAGPEKLFSKASFSGTVGEQVRSTVIKSKTGLVLALSVQTAKTSIFAVDPGQRLYLKLADGSTVTLEAASAELSEFSPAAYGAKGRAFYQVSPETADKLKASQVKMLRVESSAGPLDYELKNKFSGVISGQLTAITAQH